jgi:peroxiredoxin
MMRRTALSAALLILTTLLLAGCFRHNATPIAGFSRTPSSGPAPLAVYFDGSDSNDVDGTLISHAWGFGDGGTALGVKTTHIYDTEGTYSVELTVTDDAGAQGRFIRIVDVRSEGDLPPEGTQVGSLAADFTLPDLFSGEPRSLSDLRGYVVLLDFWASTCPPCRSSMPHLESLRDRFGDDGLVVLAVNVDVSADAARAFIEDGGFYGFLVVRDADESIRDLYDVVGIPHTYVIDRQGIIRYEDHPIRLRDRNIEPWL